MFCRKHLSRSPQSALCPELELLLCCAGTRMDPETAERIKSLVCENIEWEFLIHTALQHQVVPLLYRSLKTTCPNAVPKASFDRLRGYFYFNAHWSFVFTEKLLDLLKLFEAHEIPVLPFKGPILAKTVYGDLSLMQFSDIDIVVQRCDVLRAKDILAGGELKDLCEITLDDVEVCKDCEYRYACFDCRALAYSMTENLLAKVHGCAYDPYGGNGKNPVLRRSLSWK